MGVGLPISPPARGGAHPEGSERPTVGPARALQGGARLREGDVKTPLSRTQATLNELQSEGRLSRSRIALDQVKAASHEPAEQHIVEACYPAAHQFFGALVTDRSLHGCLPPSGKPAHCLTGLGLSSTVTYEHMQRNAPSDPAGRRGGEAGRDERDDASSTA